MKVLIVGSGGREHALAWHAHHHGHDVLVTPGNAGIAQILPCVASSDVHSVVAVAQAAAAELVIVGPEQPLVDGLVDALRAVGIAAFGPSQDAAKLEGSKAFMKMVCQKAGVATADFVVVNQAEDARAFIDARVQQHRGIVVKADGLCAGKGVEVLSDAALAHDVVASFLGGRFGSASRTVIVEDVLLGEEVSLFALCDGTDAVLFSGARDHKRLRDGDLGPNTGGMGAVAPVDDPALLHHVKHAVVLPILRTMSDMGAPFRGILFCGLMVDDSGPVRDVNVLEFNVRFGDPETEALLLGIGTDLVPHLVTVAQQHTLPPDANVRTTQHTAVVVVAAEGYPEAPQKGAVITGLPQARAVPGATVFCAGVAHNAAGELVVSGGRVLVVGGVGDSSKAALARAYEAVACIHFDGMQYRKDIGHSLL